MIIKCKMCGGDIQFNPGDTCGQCDYCGCTSTIPKADDEQKLNRYNRANHYRRQGEFDKAITAYERILEEDDTDAEAHWGVVISRYGIEYVEDPATGKRVPTCHRVRLESILADADYLAAVENAPDSVSRSLFEDEAKKIAEIQKSILAISANEDPYDVFICYKETDENGQRTRDSAIAQEVYYGLTEKGYKVFFSRITLEDKLGQQYEPYIFAALNSARVMVVIGTKPEHFNAVWVKNEWSRFLNLMDNDRKKVLIPCYRDMDPYDLPEELGNLQSQDMSKIGFMQDLIRGIQKTIEADKEKSSELGMGTQIPVSAGQGNLNALIERAFLSLEDGEFDKADDLCEMALNMDARNAKAYLGKLLADLKLTKTEDLENVEEVFEEHPQYKKIIRFGDEQLKAQLQGYNIQIRERDRKVKESESKIAIIVQDFENNLIEYCVADQNVRIDEESLSDIDREKNKLNREIQELEREIARLGLLSGSKKKVIEEKISAANERLSNAIVKANGIRARIEKYQKRIVSKPNYKDLIYEKAKVYMNNNLYGKAALEYIKIFYYRDVDEIVKRDNKLEIAIYPYVPFKEKYAVNLEEEYSAILDTCIKKAREEINRSRETEKRESYKNKGTIVEFGTYPQETNGKRKPLEWFVVEVSDNTVLLVSKYGLEIKRYNNFADKNATWKDSDIRLWLNENFFEMAFSPNEKNAIMENETNNDASQGKWHMDGGTNTRDRVFLLSYNEATELLTAEQMKCRSTPYSRKKCVSYSVGFTKDMIGSWWLRSPGKYKGHVSIVEPDGICRDSVMKIDEILVRPAIWLELTKLEL